MADEWTDITQDDTGRLRLALALSGWPSACPAVCLAAHPVASAALTLRIRTRL